MVKDFALNIAEKQNMSSIRKTIEVSGYGPRKTYFFQVYKQKKMMSVSLIFSKQVWATNKYHNLSYLLLILKLLLLFSWSSSKLKQKDKNLKWK